jgi:hypothetical protein
MDSLTSPNLLKELCQKPPLAIEPTVAGYLLKENAPPFKQNVVPLKENSLPQSANSSSWFINIIGLLFLLLFVWFFLILMVIFVLALIFNVQLRRTTWNNFWTAVCLAPGELIFSHYPLIPGSEDRLTFRRPLQSNFWTKWWQVATIPAPAILTIQLLCVERVSYTQGTDTIVETAIIDKTLLHRQTLHTGATEMVSHFDLTIPPNLPPSFEGKHNQIRWVLVVEQTLTNLLGPLQSTFTLTVNDD